MEAWAIVLVETGEMPKGDSRFHKGRVLFKRKKAALKRAEYANERDRYWCRGKVKVIRLVEDVNGVL